MSNRYTYGEPFLGTFKNLDEKDIPPWCMKLEGQTVYFQEYSKLSEYSGLHDHYHVMLCEHNSKITYLDNNEVYKRGHMCFLKRYVQKVDGNNKDKVSVLTKG